MNKKVLVRLIGISIFLTIVVLLLGYPIDGVEEAAGSNIITSSETSVAEIHPADRKFFTDSYVWVASREQQSALDIHPADRKFFTDSYVWVAPGRDVNAGSE